MLFYFILFENVFCFSVLFGFIYTLKDLYEASSVLKVEHWYTNCFSVKLLYLFFSLVAQGTEILQNASYLEVAKI